MRLVVFLSSKISDSVGLAIRNDQLTVTVHT
jgi:hypothetical protein